jgi:hypothetical protein
MLAVIAVDRRKELERAAYARSLAKERRSLRRLRRRSV